MLVLRHSEGGDGVVEAEVEVEADVEVEVEVVGGKEWAAAMVQKGHVSGG